MTLDERKRQALYYIRLAKEIQWSYEKNPWGRRHWSHLQAATLFIQPFCNTTLRPYARLIQAIRLRMTIEEVIALRIRPLLTDRIRFRRGMMSEMEASRYQYGCRWKDQRRKTTLPENSVKTQELRRLAALTLP